MSNPFDALVVLETAFLKDLELLHDVFIALVQRETVVPVPVQEELWAGFDALFAVQSAFVSQLKGARAALALAVGLRPLTQILCRVSARQVARRVRSQDRAT